MIKALKDTNASIEETGWQTEYRKSKYISNKANKPLKTWNIFLPLQEKNDVGKIAREDIEFKISQYQNQYQKQYRPKVVANHYQENDNPQRQRKRISGNNPYRDAVWYGKKTLIIGTSMLKGLRMKELKKYQAVYQKHKENILFKVECKKYHKQEKILENGKSIFFWQVK